MTKALKMNTQNHWEKLGVLSGYPLGAMTAVVSMLRHSRTFHPKGQLFEGEIRGLENHEVLSGSVMVRFSSALWKNKELPDVLGVALRMGSEHNEFTPHPQPDDQDLLFATIRKPYLTPLGPFTTQFRSYFHNEFYAVSPFEMNGERVEFRLKIETDLSKHPRAKREQQLRDGYRQVVIWLQMKPFHQPGTDWKDVAEITLDRVS
ncbi:MAG: hypothetical protein EOP09_04170, partial [Proteobacteria bacterium]